MPSVPSCDSSRIDTKNRGNMGDPTAVETPAGLPGAQPRGRERLEPPDLSEKGGLKGGQPQRSDERLFMQLLAFGGCTDSAAAVRYVQQSGIEGVMYEDVNDPRG